jgi:hypothetical protein
MRQLVSIRTSVWLLAGVVGAPTAFAADCASERSVADVQATLDAIDAAYVRADTVAFSATQADLLNDVACASEVLPRGVVAKVHRARGLRAFAERDIDGTYAAFAASKFIEPNFVFPDDFLPDGHPIRADYERADPASEELALKPPATGYLLLDGSPGDKRPIDRAVVLQYISDRGRVNTTAYLMPSDRMPILVDGPLATPEVSKPPRGTTGWWIASAASAGLGAVTYGIAATRRSAYENADPVQKPALRTQTNALVEASAGLGGIAIGTGIVAIVGRRR